MIGSANECCDQHFLSLSLEWFLWLVVDVLPTMRVVEYSIEEGASDSRGVTAANCSISGALSEANAPDRNGTLIQWQKNSFAGAQRRTNPNLADTFKMISGAMCASAADSVMTQSHFRPGIVVTCRRAGRSSADEGRLIVGLIYEDRVRESSTCRERVGRMGSEIRWTGAEIGRPWVLNGYRAVKQTKERLEPTNERRSACCKDGWPGRAVMRWQDAAEKKWPHDIEASKKRDMYERRGDESIYVSAEVRAGQSRY
jgi:hypothetical protein